MPYPPDRKGERATMTTQVASPKHHAEAPGLWFATVTRGTGEKELLIVSAHTVAETVRQVRVGDAEVAAESAPCSPAVAIVDVRVEAQPWGRYIDATCPNCSHQLG